jgi:lysophospholipase L1-like esterase
MMLPPDSRLVMIGDSITEWGRPLTTASDHDTALGHGYVALVAASLSLNFPPHPVRVINRGVGGDTVRDLAARWDRDVLDAKPHALSVMIGINDVWRYFDAERQADAVPPEEFETTYDRLLRVTRPQLSTLVLFTPFYVHSDQAEPIRARMDRFGSIVRRLAIRHGAQVIDTQAIIDALLKHTPADVLAPDRVHIQTLGHLAFARAFLAAIRTETPI